MHKLILVLLLSVLATSVAAQSFYTSGYTFTGWRASTLIYLRDHLDVKAFTYSTHSCTDGGKTCPLDSSDLYSHGAPYGKDNRNNVYQNQLADFITQNMDALGIHYVIWKQRIFAGYKPYWRPMEDRGSITANHFDHIHITFRHAAPTGTIKPPSGVTPTPTPTPTPSPNIPTLVTSLKLGSSGGQVKLWQEKLNSRGISVGIADGKFGPRTDAGTKQFQRSNGLTVDGIVGPVTWKKMFTTPNVRSFVDDDDDDNSNNNSVLQQFKNYHHNKNHQVNVKVNVQA